MKIVGCHEFIIKAFIVICRAILIEVVQTGNLVTAGNVNLIINYLHAKWLKKTGGIPMPSKCFEIFFDTFYHPYIAT